MREFMPVLWLALSVLFLVLAVMNFGSPVPFYGTLIISSIYVTGSVILNEVIRNV